MGTYCFVWSGNQPNQRMVLTWPRTIHLTRQYLLILLFCVQGISSTNIGPNNTESKRLPDEVKLVNDLLDRYKLMGKVARPQYNSSKLMTVHFGMRLIQMDIIEKEQLLKVSVWCRMRWIDEYLRWKPEDYGMIRTIVLPWNDVWTPDIVLVNTAETELEERPADIMVSYMGGVSWAPHRLFRSACLIDVTHFPYDRHTCHMWFQSMARYSWQMDLEPFQKSPWDLETYLASFKESQEWEITKNYTKRYRNSQDVGVLLKFSRRVALRFTLEVQRRMGYTCHLLMLPCVLLGSMTLIVFCLPPERPDRHTLAMGCFGSYLVLLLILIEWAPPKHGSIPTLGMYYACNMTLVMMSIFFSGMVINVTRRGDRKQLVPAAVKLIFIDILSRPLLLHTRVSKIFHRKVFSKPRDELEDVEIVSLNKTNAQESNLNGKYSESSKASENLLALQDRLRNIEEKVSNAGNINVAAQREQEIRVLKIQWRNIGLVMDRLFFALYFITLVTSLVILFPRPM